MTTWSEYIFLLTMITVRQSSRHIKVREKAKAREKWPVIHGCRDLTAEHVFVFARIKFSIISLG